MKLVAVREAVGMVLCHDITQIVPGVFKGRAFKKGHIISQRDIPELLSLGKENIYVWEQKEGMVHENDAALRIGRAVAGDGIELTSPNQGRVNLIAARRGLLKINVPALTRVNSTEQLMIATRHNNLLVEQGETLAGTKIIPLVIEEGKIQEVALMAGGPPTTHENIGNRQSFNYTLLKMSDVLGTVSPRSSRTRESQGTSNCCYEHEG